jgi:hypothetical protein
VPNCPKDARYKPVEAADSRGIGLDVAHDRAQQKVAAPPSRDLAQQWGKTAVAFILSATATFVFLLASYVLWPINRVPAVPCIALAAFFFLIFAYNSFFIVRWWFVLAKKDGAAKP